MYRYLIGKVEEVNLNYVVLECGGIGYEILVPGPICEELQARLHEEVKLYTYLQCREDGISLFGFASKDERDVFLLLISVSGIGPKGALSILSAMSTDDLRFAILSGDQKAISRCPGIGTKTAGKLILELKDKCKLEDAFEEKWNHSSSTSGAFAGNSSIQKDAIEALTALGYSPSDAIRAVRSISLTEGMTTQDLLKLSLKQL